MKNTLIGMMLCLSAAMGAQTMDAFIDSLMARMTVSEKLGQMNQLSVGDVQTGTPLRAETSRLIREGKAGALLNIKGAERILEVQRMAVEESRLGIPLLVGMDVIHGYETIFPIPIGMAATWDLEAIEESARIAATEASAGGVAWTFSPMVDIALDARWGRQAEGAGEDPYLGALVARAMVRGYQQGPHPILACVKHFALYGAAEGGRDYNTVDMSRLRMYNQYFPPYKAAVEEGAGSVMSSFNIVDGVPATANSWLLDEVLRRQWGFKGFVVSDYASISEMKRHGIGPAAQNAGRALKAGTDMDMCSELFVRLPDSLMPWIDRACRRVLEAKWRLGLFENPYRYGDPARVRREVYSRKHRDICRRITAESFVLLRNEGGLLPLERKGTLALIGPLADSRSDVAGSWAFCQDTAKYETLREAFERRLKGKVRVLSCQGSNVLDNHRTQREVARGHGLIPVPVVDDEKALEEALALAREADVVVMALGETAWMSGEGAARSDLSLPAPQKRLLQAICALGKPVVLLNFAGRATELSWESEHVPAIMNVWYGSEAGDALCDVLFGEVSPSGRLTVSMPKRTGQEPLYYSILPTGRPMEDNEPDYHVFSTNYVDVTNGALYPFGYGLTYSTFEYGRPSLEGNTLSVRLSNTGGREATEVVQLYIRDREASVSRPKKELKGFQHVTLKAGESRVVKFEITEDLLGYYNNELQWVVDKGEFDLMVGPDSRHLQSVVYRF